MGRSPAASPTGSAQTPTPWAKPTVVSTSPVSILVHRVVRPGGMRQDEKPCRPPRDAEHLADREDGVFAGVPRRGGVGDELLAARPPPRFGPISAIVPVHGSTPHHASSGLFRNPNVLLMWQSSCLS